MSKGNTATEAPVEDAGEFDTDLQAAAKAADLKAQGKRQATPDPKPGKGKGKATAKAKPKAAKAEKPTPTVQELDAEIAKRQTLRDKHSKAFNAYRKADAALRTAKKKGEAVGPHEAAKDKARAGHNSYMQAYTQQKVLLKRRTELYGAPKS
jgi:hypothetical protein